MFEIWQHIATGQHGGFAAALARAWQLGDENNQRLIEMTWPHLITKGRYFLITDPNRK